MTLITGEEYRESLRKRKSLKIHLHGEEIKNPVDHPIIKASINSVALTYELAENPGYRDLITTTSSLSGKTINRFCHLHQSTEDLQNKVRML